MPTKWMWLHLVLHARPPSASAMQRSATTRAAFGLPSARALVAMSSSTARSSERSSSARRAGRQFRLRQQDRSAALGEELRVRRLVVVHGVRERHQHARDAARRELRHGHRAGAADHQIGRGVTPCHVVDECHQLALDARRGVAGAQRIEMLLARLVHHPRALRLGQQRERLGQRIV